MSAATMTMTVPPSAAPAESAIMSTKTTTSACCPNCGLSLPPDFADPHAALLQAQKQIDDLQAQVRLLNQKAAAAVDRWADYEDELSRLRAASTTSAATTTTSASTNNNLSSGYNNNNNNRPQTPNPTPSAPASSPRSSFLPAGAASRISQLLSPRRSANTLSAQSQSQASHSSPQLPLPNGRNPQQQQQQQQQQTPHHHRARSGQSRGGSPSPSPSPSADDLLEALTREKSLRAAAEGRLQDTSKEVEELSVTLFEQANEMVAAERRARAELEARVSVLERRDGEKRARLERLEAAMDRIQRVEALLREEEP